MSAHHVIDGRYGEQISTATCILSMKL